MKLSTLIPTLSLLSLSAANPIVARAPPAPAPTVTIRNGTIIGTHFAEHNQDFFLGIPFAQPPLGNLRFAPAQPIKTKWTSPLLATSYGPRCFTVDSRDPAPESEDCLTVNVFRPADAKYKNKKLPVFVWLYGGGYINGGSNHPNYNFTYQVERSVKMGKPFIGVTFNYRLSAFGFLGGSAINAAGATNLGLRDQRLLLHWIQENIGAFGGDPAKVTLAGESAGAFSIGVQMLAYGGRDDKLFRGAMMDSGSAVISGRYGRIEDLDQIYAMLVEYTGCNPAVTGNPDTLACLRQVPFPYLSAVVTQLQAIGPIWGPVIDGDLIKEQSSVQLKRGRFVKVPIIVGSTTDEGRMFISDPATGVYGVETEEQAYQAIVSFAGPTVSNDTITEIMKLYPLSAYPERYSFPFLSQFQRLGVIATDGLYVAGQRLTARCWAERGVDSYSFRWDTYMPNPPYHAPELGVAHASDFDFWFGNVENIARRVETYDLQPAARKAQYVRIAELMGRMLISFVSEGTPNEHGVPGIPYWPEYKKDKPTNIVLDGNRTTLAYVEPDTFRKRQINLFIHRAKEFYH